MEHRNLARMFKIEELEDIFDRKMSKTSRDFQTSLLKNFRNLGNKIQNIPHICYRQLLQQHKQWDLANVI